jgi:hypothetical protein
MRSMVEGVLRKLEKNPLHQPSAGPPPRQKPGRIYQARKVEKKTSPPAKVRRKSLTSSEAGISRSMARG